MPWWWCAGVSMPGRGTQNGKCNKAEGVAPGYCQGITTKRQGSACRVECGGGGARVDDWAVMMRVSLCIGKQNNKTQK